MSFNAKNYTEQGGDVTHIGGKLVIEEGASVEGLPSSEGGGYTLPAATASTLGGVKVGSGLSVAPDGTLSADGITPAANQEDSTATTVAALRDNFNTLLASLRAAGLMASVVYGASGEVLEEEDGEL